MAIVSDICQKSFLPAPLPFEDRGQHTVGSYRDVGYVADGTSARRRIAADRQGSALRIEPMACTFVSIGQLAEKWPRGGQVASRLAR